MGQPDGPPQICTTGITDPIAGINGLMAVMLALVHRQETGEGQFIDLSQVEAATCLIGDAIVETSMNGTIPTRRGNDHRFMAPHNYYRCKGDEMWVGIAVSSDDEWRNFCEAIGNPPWAAEPRFSDSMSRFHNREALNVLVEEWTSQHDHYEVMHILQKAGVAAGPYLNSAELAADPHVKERGTFQVVDRAIVGEHPYPVPTAPMKFSETPLKIRRPAPLLGEHNEYVLGELLGMSKEEIQECADEKVIGTQPIDA
jgi:benzylsuccinate CoA-transferase BbsF subunit